MISDSEEINHVQKRIEFFSENIITFHITRVKSLGKRLSAGPAEINTQEFVTLRAAITRINLNRCGRHNTPLQP